VSNELCSGVLERCVTWSSYDDLALGNGKDMPIIPVGRLDKLVVVAVRYR
jgi:hypothetical protein